MSAGVWRNAEGLTVEEMRAAATPESERPKMLRRPDGLSAEEGAVMDALKAASNGFIDLPVQHPNEVADFVDAINRCQDLLAVRIARRAFPDGWPER